MAWDERLFQRFWNLRQKRKRKRYLKDKGDIAVELAPLKPRLTILACALTGKKIEIFSGKGEGGLRQSAFYLPFYCDRFQTKAENEAFYIFRVVYMSLQRRKGYGWETAQDYTPELALRKARASAPFVLQSLKEEFPAYFSRVKRLLDQCIDNEETFRWLYGTYLKPLPAKISLKDPIDTVDGSAEQNGENAEMTTVIPTLDREEIETITPDKKAMENDLIMRPFERIETADDFQGKWRETDNEDELEEQVEAIEELELKYAVRVHDPIHSLYQSDSFSSLFTSESPDQSDHPGRYSICYDEWHSRRRQYRKGYCRLYPDHLSEENPLYYQQTLKTLRKELLLTKKYFHSMFHRHQKKRCQFWGEDFDLDALVCRQADLFARQKSSDKVYLSKKKKIPEVSILILIDRSLSTDAYSADHRVIDTAKQSVILFSELLNEVRLPFQIDAFSSQTRNQCEYIHIKTFSQSWKNAHNRIGALEPYGYTRIGPALRHAAALLNRERHQKKWILLLSDGKPNDYDRYEGEYGIQDTRQSIKEARQKNINVYALAIENRARQYFSSMLAKNRFRICTHPQNLPKAMLDFFFCLVRQE